MAVANSTQDVPISARLYQCIATRNHELTFDNLSAFDNGISTADLYHGYSLLGDHLAAETLEAAIATIAIAADNLDDYIKQTFGGRHASDTVQAEPRASGTSS